MNAQQGEITIQQSNIFKNSGSLKLSAFIVFLALLMIGCMFRSRNGNIHSQFPPGKDALCFWDTGQYPDIVSYEYKGRIYVPYGRRKAGYGKPRVREIDHCIGYVKNADATSGEQIKEANNTDSGVYLYTLKGDNAHCYLLEYMETGLMDEPTYLRAFDTKKQDLKQLDPTEYIEPDDVYETANIWKH